MKAPCRHQLIFSVSNELCGCCLQQYSFTTSVFWSNLYFWQEPERMKDTKKHNPQNQQDNSQSYPVTHRDLGSIHKAQVCIRCGPRAEGELNTYPHSQPRSNLQLIIKCNWKFSFLQISLTGERIYS